MPGVTANMVPAALTSKLLDYTRAGKQTKPKVEPMAHEEVQLVPTKVTGAVSTVEVHKGPLNFPSISDWLKMCEDDFERGRDKHEYSKLGPVFLENGCTRIDDITRLSTDLIRTMAGDSFVEVSIGLIHRVFQYAIDDVARVKAAGRLVL